MNNKQFIFLFSTLLTVLITVVLSTHTINSKNNTIEEKEREIQVLKREIEHKEVMEVLKDITKENCTKYKRGEEHGQ